MNEIGSRSSSASDLEQADAHPIKPHEYKELPKLTDDMLARAVVNKDGRSVGRIKLGSELAEIGQQAGGFHLENERDESPAKKIPIRIDSDLYAQAESHANAEGRTIAGQIEFWALVGKAALDNPDLPTAFVRDVLISKAEDRALATPYVQLGRR